MRVVVIVDDQQMRSWLDIKLSKWGYSCEFEEVWDEAWNKCQNEAHDLIICDYSRVQHAVDALTTLINRASDKIKPYIIFLADPPEKEDYLAILHAGVDDYLITPLTSEHVRARMMAAERIIGLEKELRNQNRSLEFANLQMKNDLRVAAKIQQSFLPHSPPLWGVSLSERHTTLIELQ